MESEFEFPELTEQIAPLDPDEFRFVWGLSMEAAAGHLPTHPLKYKLTITDMPEGPTTFAIGDTVDGRAMIAAKEHFEPDKLKLQSFMTRFYGVIDLMKDPAMAQWVRDEPETTEWYGIHFAVLDAAAILPLTRLSGFDRNAFFETVAKRAVEINDAG